MTEFFKSARQALRRAFSGPGASPEEDRLFAAVTGLGPLQKRLEERLLPLQEANAFFLAHPPKSPNKAWEPVAEDTTTWSFSQLLADKLQQKGWNVYPQEGQDQVLCHALNILQVQGECSRLSFNLVIRGYKKDEHKDALAFMCAHVGDLESVMADLEKAAAADIQDKHKMTFRGLNTMAVAKPKDAPRM
jgi:hypothetical protein